MQADLKVRLYKARRNAPQRGARAAPTHNGVEADLQVRLPHMDPEIATLLTELIEKVGLLRRDIQHRKELEKYEARFARIEQKFSSLAERISRDDPNLAKALRTAWQLPARSLAFRNAEHQKELKKTDDQN
jgi:hypothetical protein